jgi:hypothetical protein
MLRHALHLVQEAPACVVWGVRAVSCALERFLEQSELCADAGCRRRASFAFARLQHDLEEGELGWAAYQFMDWLDIKLAERRDG